MTDTVLLSNAKEFGYFINTTPLHCNWIESKRWGWLWRVDTWQYCADAKAPLTYCQPDGTMIRPDRHFYLDFGSIPPPLAAFPTLSRTRFLGPYIFHDSGYRFGGLWIKTSWEEEWTFAEYTRDAADDLLRRQIRAWGGNEYQAALVYRGVRLGAPWVKYPSGDSLRR